MHNHAPKDYICPICLGITGSKSEKTLIRPSDIVFKDELVTAFITSFFIGNNPGHVVVVPNEHFENIYDLPAEYGHRIADVARKMATAVRATYDCDGIMILQNNEPASYQHAFHYHLHVFPRYKGDDLLLHMAEKQNTNAEERLPFAEKLRHQLSIL